MRQLATIAFLVIPLAACQGPSGKASANETKNKRDETALPVEVIPAFTTRMATYVTATTNLEAKSEARVLSESEGIVRELLVEEGAQVVRGQVLARMDDREARVESSRAAAKAGSDAAALRRAEEVAAKGLMSREEFERVELAARLSKAELDAAELRLAQKEVRAPFDGTVTTRLCRIGEQVVPNQHLFTVADFDPLIAVVHLPESRVRDLAVGSAVSMTAATPDVEADGPSVTAFVEQVSPVVDPKTGTIKVTLAVPEPPAGLRPGSFLRIRLVQEAREGALVVPREAIVRDLAESFVFVIDLAAKGERVDKRRVELGLTDRGYVEVSSGVAAGDKVVTSGQGGLRAHSLVKVVRERPVPADAAPTPAVAAASASGIDG